MPDMTRQDWQEHSDSKPENSPRERLRTANLLERIRRLAEKAAIPDGDPRAPTFECPDCTDIGWIIVPCRVTGCSECKMGATDHRRAIACLTCEKGIAREAGIWYRFLYHRDRKGNPVMIASKLKTFQQAMVRLGHGSKRVMLALDAIVDRERAPKPQEKKS